MYPTNLKSATQSSKVLCCSVLQDTHKLSICWVAQWYISTHLKPDTCYTETSSDGSPSLFCSIFEATDVHA